MRKMAGLAVVLLLVALTQTPVAIAGCTAFCNNYPSLHCSGFSSCSSTSSSITCDGVTYGCPFRCPDNPQVWCWEPPEL